MKSLWNWSVECLWKAFGDGTVKIIIPTYGKGALDVQSFFYCPSSQTLQITAILCPLNNLAPKYNELEPPSKTEIGRPPGDGGRGYEGRPSQSQESPFLQ
jgi:hypothetical protein